MNLLAPLPSVMIRSPGNIAEMCRRWLVLMLYSLREKVMIRSTTKYLHQAKRGIDA